MDIYFLSGLIKFLLLSVFLLKCRYNIKSTEIHDAIDFKVIIHGAVGVTGSEIVVGIGVKASQYFTIAHVNACALGVTRGIS